jgi:hypothetical protein
VLSLETVGSVVEVVATTDVVATSVEFVLGVTVGEVSVVVSVEQAKRSIGNKANKGRFIKT